MDSNNLQFDVEQHLTQDSDSIGGEREDGSSNRSHPTHTSEAAGGRGGSHVVGGPLQTLRPAQTQEAPT